MKNVDDNFLEDIEDKEDKNITEHRRCFQCLCLQCSNKDICCQGCAVGVVVRCPNFNRCLVCD